LGRRDDAGRDYLSGQAAGVHPRRAPAPGAAAAARWSSNRMVPGGVAGERVVGAPGPGTLNRLCSGRR
jgi:hypothetical protein